MVVVEWCACFGDRRCWLFGCLIFLIDSVCYSVLGDVSCRRKKDLKRRSCGIYTPLCTVNP
jgi:hypothetical protein